MLRWVLHTVHAGQRMQLCGARCWDGVTSAHATTCFVFPVLPELIIRCKYARRGGAFVLCPAEAWLAAPEHLPAISFLSAGSQPLVARHNLPFLCCYSALNVLFGFSNHAGAGSLCGEGGAEDAGPVPHLLGAHGAAGGGGPPRRRAAPCCPMLRLAGPCWPMLPHAAPCCPMLPHAAPCWPMLPHAAPCPAACLFRACGL